MDHETNIKVPGKGHLHLQQDRRYIQMEELQQGQPTRALRLPEVPNEPHVTGWSEIRYEDLCLVHFLQPSNYLLVSSRIRQVRSRSL